MNRTLSLSFLGLALVVVALAIWFAVFLPSLILRQAQTEVLNRTGRILAVSGGASLQVTPQLSIALHDISLAGASTMAEPVIKAKALVIPISIAQALGMQNIASRFSLDSPVFAMRLNGDGHSNVIIEDAAANAKVDANAPLPMPFEITFTNGAFKFVDDVNSKSFMLSELEGQADIDNQDEIALKAAATLAGQRVHFTSALKSLPRAFGEGSPLDFNLEGVGAAFGFSGRVVAARGFDLAGQASVDTDDSARLLKWLGIDLHGLHDKLPLTISSVVESQGPLFLLKKTDVQFAHMKAAGDISFSGAGVRPSVTLALGVDDLNLNMYGTTIKSDAPRSTWREQVFDLNDFNTADIQFRLAANALHFGEFSMASAQVEGSLKDGLMTAHISNDAVGNAALNVDAKQVPPKLNVELALSKIEAKTLFKTFAGMDWLSGPIDLNAKLSATGKSQAAMISSLNGTVEVKTDHVKFEGVELAGLVAQVFSEPVSGWKGVVTEPVAMNADLKVEDGIASLSKSELTAPGIKLNSVGELDVLRQALNLDVDAVLNRGDGKPAKISVNGPWVKPDFALVKSGN